MTSHAVALLGQSGSSSLLDFQTSATLRSSDEEVFEAEEQEPEEREPDHARSPPNNDIVTKSERVHAASESDPTLHTLAHGAVPHAASYSGTPSYMAQTQASRRHRASFLDRPASVTGSGTMGSGKMGSLTMSHGNHAMSSASGSLVNTSSHRIPTTVNATSRSPSPASAQNIKLVGATNIAAKSLLEQRIFDNNNHDDVHNHDTVHNRDDVHRAMATQHHGKSSNDRFAFQPDDTLASILGASSSSTVAPGSASQSQISPLAQLRPQLADDRRHSSAARSPTWTAAHGNGNVRDTPGLSSSRREHVTQADGLRHQPLPPTSGVPRHHRTWLSVLDGITALERHVEHKNEQVRVLTSMLDSVQRRENERRQAASDLVTRIHRALKAL